MAGRQVGAATRISQSESWTATGVVLMNVVIGFGELGFMGTRQKLGAEEVFLQSSCTGVSEQVPDWIGGDGALAYEQMEEQLTNGNYLPAGRFGRCYCEMDLK